MAKKRETGAALAVVAAAVGADFAAGREPAAFYAQMAGASWLGAAFSALVFGLVTALVAYLARRYGADNLFALLRRAPGGALGRAGAILYAGILLMAGASLIDATGRLGELALPLRHARQFGIAAALLLAARLSLGGVRGLGRAGAGFAALLLLYELALALFAQLEELPGMQFVLELRLADSRSAALLFGALHAAMCACMSAGVALRAAGEGASPGRLGVRSAAVFLLILLAGNAALRGQADELLALETPFVALAACWGRAGFWGSAVAIYFAAVTSLAGLLAGMIPRQWMLNSADSHASH